MIGQSSMEVKITRIKNCIHHDDFSSRYDQFDEESELSTIEITQNQDNFNDIMAKTIIANDNGDD